ncbi:hypothetical protein KIF24_03065 [Micromonospora sp. Llam7]|uniref:hypothetical protein n=1 Tax=Micromonospora tarapacensis TaxID=2835305 RepID=UPI001C830BD1|nr:hypothetical protein [Micromonospora tarapacensis]MBX7265138.1 hypothetical protein [Micromonospora tarapacensis]
MSVPSVRPAARRWIVRGPLGGGCVHAGRHLKAGGGGADGRHLHRRGHGGRQTDHGSDRLLAGRHGAGSRHDEAVTTRSLARPSYAGWGAHRGVPAGRRLLAGGRPVDVVAVHVVAVDPGGQLGLRLRAGRGGQIAVAGRSGGPGCG